MEILRKHPMAVDGKIVHRVQRVNGKVVTEVYYLDENNRKYKNLHDLMNNIPMK